MSTNYRNTQLTIGFHPTFAAQDAIGTPLPLASLTAAMNVVTRRHIQPEVRGEDVLSCNGRYKVGEVIFNRIARLQVEMDFDAAVTAGLFGMALGVTAAPDNVAATDEVQTLDSDATGGTFKLEYDGERTATAL